MTPPVVTLQRLQELRGILKPLGIATDRLQGDGVTSSTLHLCIATCYLSIANQICDEAWVPCASRCRFPELQSRLLAQLKERFREPLKNEYLVAASVLNPRQKLRCFQNCFALQLPKSSAEEAAAAVKTLLERLCKVRLST